MKEKIVRRIDELGRIVLPQDFRSTLLWSTETKIAITREGSQLILQADTEACVLCGNEKNLIQIKNKHICNDCISKATGRQ